MRFSSLILNYYKIYGEVPENQNWVHSILSDPWEGAFLTDNGSHFQLGMGYAMWGAAHLLF